MRSPVKAQNAQVAANASDGLRPSFSRCIDEAAGAVPATQNCIEAETIYQQRRLDAAMERLAGAHPEQAGAQRYAQAAWAADVENKCPWNAATEGQGQRIEANMCALEELAKRADILTHQR